MACLLLISTGLGILIGSLWGCPADCCSTHPENQGRPAFEPPEPDESHHFCTSLICGSGLTFLIEQTPPAFPPLATERVARGQPQHPHLIITDPRHRPPRSSLA